MRVLGKVLGLLALVLLLALVAAGFALTYWFDPNDYKEQLRQLAREQAGIELNIDGDIGWSLFPWLGLRLTDTSLASVRTPDQPLAAVHRLDLAVQVMPLLRREVRMRRIDLDGLAVTLVRDEQGQENWAGVGQPLGLARPPANTPVAVDDIDAGADEAVRLPDVAQDSVNPPHPLILEIERVAITDAHLSYQDAQTGQQWAVDQLSLLTEDIRPDQWVPIQLSARLKAQQPNLSVQTEGQGRIQFDWVHKRYHFDSLRWVAELSGAFLNESLKLSLQGALVLDARNDSLEGSALKLGLNQIRALGEFKAQHLTEAFQWSGALSVAPFNPREFWQGLGQKRPVLADEQALQHAEFVTKLHGTSKQLVLEDFQGTLDDSHIQGRIAIVDFANAALQVQLSGDRWDATRYLVAPSLASEKNTAANAPHAPSVQDEPSGDTALPEAPNQTPWSKASLLPSSALNRLNVQAQLSLSHLRLPDHTLEDVALKAHAGGGQLYLDEFAARLAGGAVEASATLDTHVAVPALALKARVKEVPLEALLKPKDVPMTGLLTAQADLRTQGESPYDWVSGLSGRADFILDKGVLLKANLEQQLCRAVAAFKRQSLTQEPQSNDTAFRAVRSSWVLHEGIASSSDLTVAIPGLSVQGNGEVDLRVLGLDYQLGVLIEGDQRAMPDPACQINKQLARIEWPLRCRGALGRLAQACRVDKEALLGMATKSVSQKITDKVEHKLDEKLGSDWKETAKGLFKR